MTGAEIFSTYLSKIGALFPCGHIRQHGFLFVTAVVWERPRLHKWGCNAHPCLFFSGPNPLLSPVGRPCAACKGKGTFSAKKTQSSSCSAPFMGSGYCRSAIASESVLHVAQHSACISGVGSMRSGTRNTGRRLRRQADRCVSLQTPRTAQGFARRASAWQAGTSAGPACCG